MSWLSDMFAGGVKGILDSGKELIEEFHLSPEQAQKFEQWKQQAALDAQKLALEHATRLEEFAAKDRDSARQREIAVKDRTPATLAFVIVGGFLAATLAIIGTALSGYEIPAGAAGLVGTLIGYLSAKSELALAYYFGSTSGSNRKTELLAQADSIK